jgi:hypothetical protein
LTAPWVRRLAWRLPLYREILEIRDHFRVMRNLQARQYCDAAFATDPRYSDPARLPRYTFAVNSQNGEDGILHEIFQRIGAESRFFVEIGVGDGTENNTAFLLAQGWSGVWIDGDPAFTRTLAARPDLAAGVKGHCVYVSRENVATVLRDLAVPEAFDLLSLDVDQNTYYVWEGLAAFRPRVVAIEYNGVVHPAVDWKVAYDPGRVWDGGWNCGASLKAFERLGARMGYALVGCDFNGVNAFFVREDLAPGRFAAPFTAENHYEPPRLNAVPRFPYGRTILERPAAPRSQT